MDFTSNGLEDAFFESCDFEDIDIRSVAATALMFEDCRFGHVQVSVENFVAIIGSSSFLRNARSYSLSGFEETETKSVSSKLDECIKIIERYLASNGLDVFQTMNTLIQLKVVESHDLNIPELNAVLRRISAETPILAFDQVSNIVKLIEHYEIEDHLDLEPLKVLFS